MDSFKPAPPPVGKRLLANPLFHFATLLILALLIGLYIRSQKHEFFSNAYKKITGPYITEKKAAAEFEDEASGAAPTEEPEIPEVAAVAETTTTAAVEMGTPNIPGRFQIRMSFVEISRAELLTLKNSAVSSGQYLDSGELFTGLVPDIKNKIQSLKSLKTHEQIEKTFDVTSNSYEWFSGLRNEEDIEYGLHGAITASIKPEGGYRAEIELLRSLAEEAEAQPTKRAYPVIPIEMSPGAGWMIAMTLPRHIQQVLSSKANSSGFLEIFRSAPFKSGQTEFTILLEFDTPSSSTAGKTQDEP